jgi:hypothetical protein
MLTKQEQIERLQDCIALLEDVDARQQAALGASDVTYDNHNRIQDLIFDFQADIDVLTEDEAEYDGQPDEMQEWHDFDPDC